MLHVIIMDGAHGMMGLRRARARARETLEYCIVWLDADAAEGLEVWC